MVICKTCELEKPEEEYYQGPSFHRGIALHCKRCMYDLKIKRQSNMKGRLSQIVNDTRRRAKDANMDHDIDYEYLVSVYENQNGKCALTGETLVFEIQPRIKLRASASISIDRIDSQKGYVRGNIQFVTFQANMAKGVFSNEEFLELCKKVVNTL